MYWLHAIAQLFTAGNENPHKGIPNWRVATQIIIGRNARNLYAKVQ